MPTEFNQRLQMLSRKHLAVGGVALGLIALAGSHSRISAERRRVHPTCRASPARDRIATRRRAAEWASLTVEPVTEHVFRAEHVTEGKIAVNEDSSTPIFSPYAGRVTKLLVKPSDKVERGQPLFVVEATDTVQGLNDFITALSALNKARSKLNLAQIVEKRANDLLCRQGGAAQGLAAVAGNDLTTAQNDMRSAETALEAAHNRLRILGRSDEQIIGISGKRADQRRHPDLLPDRRHGRTAQGRTGPVHQQRRQRSGLRDRRSLDGVADGLCAGDRSGGRGGRPGDRVHVLAMPGSEFKARIDYVSAAIDPATRRLLVRATIDNKDGLLKPEMFANVTIYSGGDHPAVGVPKQALIYEGDQVRLWVAHDDKSIELRQIETGLTNGDLVEVRTNLKAGEKIVTRGSLFIDRAASGS